MGLDKIIELMDDLTVRYGARFKPAQILKGMAAKGEKFY